MTSRCFAFGSRNSRGKVWEGYPDQIVFHFDLRLSFLFPQMGLLKISKDLLSKFPWSFPVLLNVAVFSSFCRIEVQTIAVWQMAFLG